MWNTVDENVVDESCSCGASNSGDCWQMTEMHGKSTRVQEEEGYFEIKSRVR